MPWLSVAFQLLSIAFYTPNYAQRNPHQPQNLTWVISDTHGDILNSTSSIVIPGSWFPDLQFDLAKMLQITAKDDFIKTHHFYVCPGHMKETKIGTLENMVLERHHYQPVRSEEDMERTSPLTLDSDNESEFIKLKQLRRSMLTLDGGESEDHDLQNSEPAFKTKTEEMLG